MLTIRCIDRLFWSKVKTGSKEDCWEWQGALYSNGYGFVRRRKYKKAILAHRYSFFLCGKLEDLFSSIKVLHKCDNPKCVNPDHLYLGTQQDNMRDKIDRNRQAKGSRQGKSILTEEIVLEIKKLLLTKMPKIEISKTLNVSPQCVYDIGRDRTWKHIDVLGLKA